MRKQDLAAILGMYALGATMSRDGFSSDYDKNEYQKKGKSTPGYAHKPEPKPSKGQKRYFFNELGNIDTGMNSVVVFQCYAINEKNAIRKFNQWKEQQP